jgi:serine/threonine protein kinase
VTTLLNEIVGERYRVLEHLGQGGMGTVMIAEHVELGRRVALKVLQDKIGEDATMRKRFQREARTLAAMQHPNIVALNDYGLWQGTPYLVMELLEGRTLRDLLDAEKTLPLERALDITQQILRALGYAHGHGVIHRDLKPGNVFLQALPDQLDHVKLLDFGFAKFTKPDAAASLVTGDGILVGTPAYMAPEQATAARVDHRADLYSVGVLLFEMLSGRKPFEGSAMDLLRERLLHDAPSLRAVRPDLAVAPELEEVIERSLVREMARRWQSAADFSAALAKLPPDALVPGDDPGTARPDVDRPTARNSASATTELSTRDLLPLESTASGRGEALPLETTPMRSLTPLWIALSVVVVAIAAWQLWPDAPRRVAEREEPPPPEPIAVRSSPAPEPVEEPPPPEPIAEPTLPRDPWATGVPTELHELSQRIASAARPSPSDLRSVASYVHHHEDDVRGVLLLAHGYAKARNLGGALDRYEDAYALDPLSRGDPRMLEDLIALASSRAYAERASRLIASAYGPEALPSLERAITEASDERGADQLRELRDRIAAATP